MSSYLEFYRLRKHPFDGRPGRGPVFATRPLRDALAWIEACIREDRSVACVRGLPGVGRSSLARVIPGRLAAQAHVARIPDVRRPWADVALDLAEQLCLPDVSRGSLLHARSLGQRVVLVIDGAERADAALLRSLGALLDLRGPARERLVQAVLMARVPQPAPLPQPPLWCWLERRSAAVWDLAPIPPDEIHRYICKRLQSAGRGGDPLFTESAALIVHRHSQGVPRRVNQVCDAVLREALCRCTRRIDGRLVVETLAYLPAVAPPAPVSARTPASDPPAGAAAAPA